MSMLRNGAPARRLSEVRWQKSRRSNPSGNCVEMGLLPSGEIAVRNSRHPEGSALVYSSAEIAEFLHGAKAGDFDHLLS